MDTALKNAMLKKLQNVYLEIKIIEAKQQHGLASASQWREQFDYYRGFRDAMQEAKILTVDDCNNATKMAVTIDA